MTTFDSILLKLLPVQRLNNLRLSKASKENLKAEFTDELGRWWYTFQDEQDLPLIRLASQQTYLQYMAAGLTGKHFDEAMELLTECLAKQDIVKAGVVIHELKLVRNMDCLENGLQLEKKIGLMNKECQLLIKELDFKIEGENKEINLAILTILGGLYN
jgi:hypothetical protein